MAPDDLPAEHLGRLLLRAHRAVTDEAMPLVRRLGHPALRAGHLPVFGNIDADGTRITELAERAAAMSRRSPSCSARTASRPRSVS